MMYRKILLVLITALFSLSFVLVGCGVAPEKYDQLAAELAKAQEQMAKMRGETQDLQGQIQKLQDQIQELQAQKDVAAAELKAAQAKIAELEGQASGLKEQYELVGATPAETAANIVRHYHETHVYSTYDLFVCSDMASEVWNMLKAQGISARIVIGNKDMAITDILQSNHAWVQAEVAPGEYLALETTGGFVVPKSENALYYRGWSFDSPAKLKSNNRLIDEYNVRVDMINQFIPEINGVVEEYNAAVDEWNEKYASNPSSTDAQILDARMGEIQKKQELLIEMKREQEAQMNDIKAKLNSLATKCGT